MNDTERIYVQAALSHLRCALVQVHPSDDKIIVEHMRDAVDNLERINEPLSCDEDNSSAVKIAPACIEVRLANPEGRA